MSLWRGFLTCCLLETTPVLRDLLYSFTTIVIVTLASGSFFFSLHLPPFLLPPTLNLFSITWPFGWDTFCLCFTFRNLPGLPQLFHSDVLVFTVQVAVFVGLLLLHVFYYKLGKEERQYSVLHPIKYISVGVQHFKMSVFQLKLGGGGCRRLCLSVYVHVWFWQRGL